MASRPDEEWIEEIRGLEERLEAGVWDLLEGKKRRVAELAGSYVFREPRRMVEMSAQRVDELGLQLQRGLENAWRHRKQMAVALLQRWMALRPERKVAECGLRLKGAIDRLRALGPEETLRRGYTLLLSLSLCLLLLWLATRTGRATHAVFAACVAGIMVVVS